MNDKKDKPVCLRCSGRMEEGFISDTIAHTTVSSFWTKGRRSQLAKSSDAAISIPILDKAFPPKPKEVRQTLEIDAYRCELCGYLELYAHKPTHRRYKNLK